MQTKDMDVEQDTSGSDKLLQWPLKKEYGNTQIHKIFWDIRIQDIISTFASKAERRLSFIRLFLHYFQ